MKAKIQRKKFQEEHPGVALELLNEQCAAGRAKRKLQVEAAKRNQGRTIRAIREIEKRRKMGSPGYRIGSVKSRHAGRRSATKTLRRMAENKVETLTLSAIEEKILAGKPVTREEVAHKIGCQVHQVGIIFEKLNRAGILAQKSRSFAHDTRRNPIFPGTENGWSANYYHPTKEAARRLEKMENQSA